jgi:transposase InsO family protein
LERAYTRLACKRAGIADVEEFKKRHWPAGHEAVALEGEHFGVTVGAVCRKVGISRQNYYARRKARQRREVDAELVVALVIAERQLQPRLGARKLHFMLKGTLAQEGVVLGWDGFIEVLRQKGLLLEPKPAAYPCTTNSHHCLPVFRNRIKGLAVSKPNEVWVGDLTYIRTAMGFLFLALLTDKRSRKVVGYHCGETLEAGGCLAALKNAVAEMPTGATPIHHSDQGTQYCSHEYVNWVVAHGLSMSMTETDHCAENALAERINGILKSEYGLGRQFQTKAEALLAVGQAIHLYNTRRPHTALGYRTPQEAHRLAA